jgi:hypothetical protein
VVLPTWAAGSFSCDYPSGGICQDNYIDSVYAAQVCPNNQVSSCDVATAGKAVVGACVTSLLRQVYYAPITSGIAQQTCSAISGALFNASVPTTPTVPPPVIGDPATPLLPPVASQSIYKVADGTLPAAAVVVSASGTLGAATVAVTFDFSKISAAMPFGFAAGYNVYVGALVPGRQVGSASDVWFVENKSANWVSLSFPLAAFLENVAVNSVDDRRLVRLVTNADITRLIGTEIYVGYGLSDQEMLAAKRIRGIYTVRAQ